MPIKQYLNQEVTLKTRSSYDKYGSPQTGSGSTVNARFQEKAAKFLSNRGDEIVTDAEVWFEPDVDVSNDDIVTYGGVDYRVVRKDTKRGYGGTVNHIKCLLKRMT